jgi:hypothetical protein
MIELNDGKPPKPNPYREALLRGDKPGASEPEPEYADITP